MSPGVIITWTLDGEGKVGEEDDNNSKHMGSDSAACTLIRLNLPKVLSLVSVVNAVIIEDFVVLCWFLVLVNCN